MWGHNDVHWASLSEEDLLRRQKKQKLPGSVKACWNNRTEMNKYLQFAIEEYRVPPFAREVGEYSGEDQFTQTKTIFRQSPEDCHYVPQHIYAQTVPKERIFCSIREALEMLGKFGRHGGTGRLHELKPHKNQLKENLFPETIALFRKHYAKDFKLFESCLRAPTRHSEDAEDRRNEMLEGAAGRGRATKAELDEQKKTVPGS